jgi:hypothetical protein
MSPARRVFYGLVSGLLLGFWLASAAPPADAQVAPSQVGCYYTTTVLWNLDAGAPNSTIAYLDGGTTQLPISNFIQTSYCSGVNIVCTLTPGGSSTMNVVASLQESNDNVNWITLPGTSQTISTGPATATNVGWVQWDNASPLIRVAFTTNNSDGGVAYCTASMKGS